MNSSDVNWRLGEIVSLPRTEREVKDGGSPAYKYFVESRYICVREATDSQRGILVKVLGKSTLEHILMVCGKPFSKDDRHELFMGDRYFSYPFPAADDVKEVLEILRSNPNLVRTFEDASMHINLKSKYWVTDTKRRFLIKTVPQCYDANSDQLITPSYNDFPYRITMVYFSNGQLIW